MPNTMQSWLDRLSTLTSVKRTRHEHVTRLDRNGGTHDELKGRQRAAVARLAAAVRELEATL